MAMKRKYLVLTVMAIMPLSFLVSKASLSGDVTPVQEAPQGADLKSKVMDMSYDKARKVILESGWGVVENSTPDDLMFATRDIYDQGFVEVEMCSPVGLMSCKFYFKNEDGEYLQVLTEGEEPHVQSVEVQSADLFKELHSFSSE